jgi:gliding motility-associated-like protein
LVLLSCLPGVDTTKISVEKLAIVNAGPDQTVCAGIDNVDVNGQVTNGIGGKWTTTGTGSFLNPNMLVTKYRPSLGDSIAGSVYLILTSKGNIQCLPQKDTLKLTLQNVINPDFTYSAACSGMEILFNENCQVYSGDITAYKWDFGGGVIVYTQNASHTFSTPGNHPVTLTVTSSYGCIYSKTKVVYVNPQPFADFTTDAQCYKEMVHFTDISTVPLGGTIVGWNWNFGDNYFSNERNPSHQYQSDGVYNVILTVTTTAGCVDSILRSITVLPSPIADFSNSDGCVNDTIYFVDASTFPGGNINACSWYWNFGGGIVSTSRNPFHIWTVEGSYIVSLVVTSEFGCSDTLLKSITVSTRPIAGFTFPDTNLVVNKTIHFTDSSFFSSSWMWDFGDNTDTSGLRNPSHIYFNPGTYTVTQTVFNGTCPDVIMKIIKIKGIEDIFPPKVPTAFSPNNDGINDILFVRGGPFSSLQFIIYNNWGELIFESNSQDIGWDGTRKGKKEPVGVYLWTVKAVTIDGTLYTKTGETVIIR